MDLIPCAESVRFVKDGSCATEAAIRVARAATGRDIVLVCGYHSWHSWYAATREAHPGVPEWMLPLVQTFQHNDLASLDLAIDCKWAMGDGKAPGRAFGSMGGLPSWRRGDTGLNVRGIAAIILEPTLIEPPAPGFLEGVRERATRIGAVLIFDEMVTGFRWHAGGAQALYGVTPDLACFGKGMGNGYPIAALVGRGDLMRHARLVSGTFGGDCIGLAAADATLARYQEGGVCEHMWRLGRVLMDGYNALAKTLGAPTRMEGQPPHPVIRWDEDGEPDYERLPYGQIKTTLPNRWRASLFFQETVWRGHLMHPEGLNVMLATTEADVRSLLAACEAAMIEVLAAIGDGKVRERIEGDPISPEPAWRVAR